MCIFKGKSFADFACQSLLIFNGKNLSFSVHHHSKMISEKKFTSIALPFLFNFSM